MKILSENGLFDIWKNIHPDQEGFTFPANDPQKRIDQFWCNRQFLKKVKNIRTTGAENCSDHLAISLEFDL